MGATCFVRRFKSLGLQHGGRNMPHRAGPTPPECVPSRLDYHPRHSLTPVFTDCISTKSIVHLLSIQDPRLALSAPSFPPDRRRFHFVIAHCTCAALSTASHQGAAQAGPGGSRGGSHGTFSRTRRAIDSFRRLPRALGEEMEALRAATPISCHRAPTSPILTH